MKRTDKDPVSVASAQLMDNALPFHLLQNILTCYVDLPCFLLRPDDWKTWNTLVTLGYTKVSPLDFESGAQWKARIRYNERSLAKAFAERKAQCTQYLGLYGLFVPVLKDGRCVGVLQSGAFLRGVPDEAQFLALWKGLSGRGPGPRDQTFLEYARAVVDTPILDDALVEGLRETLEVFGAFLTRSLDGEGAARRLGALQTGVFARRLWHRRWLSWQAVQPKFFRFNGDPRSLMQWEIDELGIRRFPTTILAAKREGTGREWADWLAALAFQRQSLEVARELDETLCYPLENYGVLLATSARPGLSKKQAEEDIRGRAEEFSRRISRRLGCRIWVGIGGTDPMKVHFQDSYQEAVAALHLAVAKNQPTASARDFTASDYGETQLRHRIVGLTELLVGHGRAPATPLIGAFIQDVLVKTRGRPEATRRVFMETLHRILSALEARRGVEERTLAELDSDITLPMETAIGLNDMVGRFQAALSLLLSFLDRAQTGDKYLRIRKAREAIEGSLQEAWTLPAAARQFGFSKTVFSREFSSQVGLPFSDFLLNRRLEKAKRLLHEGLALESVAEACGFRSRNYFIQIFKRKVGTPPGRFQKTVQHINE